MTSETKSKLKFYPTFAELCDSLSIKILKRVFIPQNKDAYDQEIKDILHDLDLIIEDKGIKLNAESIKAILIIMLSNRAIWEQESKARAEGNQDLKPLLYTHSINGIRNSAKNSLANQLGERKDLKIDCLAAELKSEFQNWDLFKN
jgi:hypothetical protein